MREEIQQNAINNADMDDDWSSCAGGFLGWAIASGTNSGGARGSVAHANSPVAIDFFITDDNAAAIVSIVYLPSLSKVMVDDNGDIARCITIVVRTV